MFSRPVSSVFIVNFAQVNVSWIIASCKTDMFMEIIIASVTHFQLNQETLTVVDVLSIIELSS